MAPIPAGTRIDKYEVERWLGGGGMGDVYLATDTNLATRVAIKVIKAEVDSDETRQRFLREAQLVAALRNHPNIVPIYEFGQYDSRPFFTMEYIEGRSLAAVIKAGTPSLTVRLRWLEELCQGLQFAHDHGVVHRDIKPANLMIDDLGRLRILDFGIARIADATRAQFRLEGTLPYMAPEAVRGEESDRRVDVFSAAAVAYELLTLTRAFEGDTEATVIYNVVSTPPRSFREFSVAGLDEDLERIVFKGLHKEPTGRYATAVELGAALGQVRQRLDQAVPDGAGQFATTVRVVRDGPGRAAARKYALLAGVLALTAVVIGGLIYSRSADAPRGVVARVATDPADPGLSPPPSTSPAVEPPASETPRPTDVEAAPPLAPPLDPAGAKPTVPGASRPSPLTHESASGSGSGPDVTPAPTPDPIDLFKEGAAAPSHTARPGLLVRVLRDNGSRGEQLVDPDTHVFRTGDAFRFAFRSNIDGFLYVAKETPGNRWEVLFPDPEFNDGSNAITRNRTMVIPGREPDDWFDLIEPRPASGIERVFVLLSRSPIDVLRRLNSPVRESQTLALADIDRAAATVATREIGRRKSIPAPASGPSPADAGTYVVNVADGDAVVLRFELKHEAPLPEQ